MWREIAGQRGVRAGLPGVERAHYPLDDRWMPRTVRVWLSPGHYSTGERIVRSLAIARLDGWTWEIQVRVAATPAPLAMILGTPGVSDAVAGTPLVIVVGSGLLGSVANILARLQAIGWSGGVDIRTREPQE